MLCSKVICVNVISSVSTTLYEDIASVRQTDTYTWSEAVVVGVNTFPCCIYHRTYGFAYERIDMICDNCRQGTYTKLAIHSNVKSSVHIIVQCFECGYQTIKKENSKRRLESIV